MEEIVAVMRAAGDGAHGRRLRGLIVVLWRAGLRIAEALALGESDLDPRLLPVDSADMSRCEPDGDATFVAAWGTAAAVFRVGSRWALGGKNLSTLVARTGRPARIESYADASGPIDTALHGTGIRSAVGTPILVEGRLWGVMSAASSREEPLPADTETRLTQFTELLATAVANAEGRAGLARLAEEQAALRRVATLVARGAAPEEVFAAVAEEVGRLLSVDLANVIRYEPDGTVTFVASAGKRTPVDSRWPLGETNLAASQASSARNPRSGDRHPSRRACPTH